MRILILWFLGSAECLKPFGSLYQGWPIAVTSHQSRTTPSTGQMLACFESVEELRAGSH
jgi:hypothetical protein